MSPMGVVCLGKSVSAKVIFFLYCRREGALIIRLFQIYMHAQNDGACVMAYAASCVPTSVDVMYNMNIWHMPCKHDRFCFEEVL